MPATLPIHHNGHKPRVLAADDEPTSLMVLTTLLEDMGYDVVEAHDGREALDIIEREGATFSGLVLDRMMPGMNGIEVVHQLKDDPRAQHIPIVMVTGANKPEEVKEGVDAGVFYYLTKPYEEALFSSVMESAMREAQRRRTLKTELKKHQTSFKFIDEARFTIHSVEDAEDLACFVANCFPDPDRSLPGLASLLVNAVEHGSLEIGYDTKTKLLKEGTWQQEINRRAVLPEYAGRTVSVVLERTDREVRLTIEDEGPGFDSSTYMNIDPARALDPHGRGIAQANKISFDSVEYNQKGNIVTATSYSGSGIKW